MTRARARLVTFQLVTILVLLAFARAAEAARAERLELVGFHRVERAVIEDVLPRSLPAEVSDAELTELERRLWVMAIFDDVAVARHGDAIRISVREKWTLVPSADFGTSRTLEDSYALVSLSEFNTLGRAQETGAYVAYLERAASTEVWTSELQTAARRTTFEGGASFVGSGLTFTTSPFNWERRRTGGRLGVRLPFLYGRRFRFAVLSSAYRESLDGAVRPGLGDGTFVGIGLRAVWDAYTWNDVAPSGVRLTVEAVPGTLARDERLLPRHAAFAQALVAVPLTSKVVVVANVVGEVVSPGDPNHSALLGNVSGYRFSTGATGGVRGLADNVYRDTAHVYGDLELRGALTLAPRWYLQGTAFADAGMFAPMDVDGKTRDPRLAFSTGLGLRLVPTAVASFVPRVDVGRRHSPTAALFWTFGLSQYF